jgi:uncharacterized protein (DUF362 family)
MQEPKRRTALAAALSLGLASCSKNNTEAKTNIDTMPPLPEPQQKAQVAVLKASSYEGELLAQLEAGLAASWPSAAQELRGKRVLLKPNLVEFDANTCINTDPRVVLAARELFLKIGAAEVRIGEGPGHRRDTWDLAEKAGYRKIVPGFDDAFIDLNLDDVSPVRAFDKSMDLYLPHTALGADLIVSIAKMKTHHWAGATLSMKNFFGVVPGAVYGWPKNLLHYQGIDKSIVELNRIFRKTFAIVDGITAMEGNGPIQGTPIHPKLLVMGRDLAAVDATCARLMRLDPLQMSYLRGAAALRLPGLGAIQETAIEQRGEKIHPLSLPFQVVEQFSALKLVS